MKAKGIYVNDYMELKLDEYEVPEVGPNDILIKTMACGLCCWDSWLYRGVNAPGPYPYLIGHEGVGIVEKVGAGITKVKPGDKVYGRGNFPGMTEYSVISEDGCVILPEDTTNWVDVIYEPTTCVVNLLNIADVHIGDHVVLVGAGYMGLLTLQGLTRASQVGRITVFELREDRRKMAEAYGPTEVLDPESEEGKKVIAEIIAKGGADVCIDFGASEGGFHLADSMTKMAGKLIIGSFHRGDVTFDGTKWHLGGLYVYNLAPMSNPYFHEMLPRTFEMVKKGVFEPGKLVTHTAYYEDMDAMKHMFDVSCSKEDNYMKGVVLFYKE